MFIPNNWAEVREPVGYNMRSGIPDFGAPMRKACGLVRLRPKAQKTSVRADSSATRGSSDEIVADAVILFEGSYHPPVDTVVAIAGVELRVLGVEPRFAVTGVLDHHEVTLEYWSA